MDPHQEALTLALFVQAILYGVYVTTSGCCLRSFLYDKGQKLRRNIRWTFCLAAFFVLILSTIDIGVSLPITLAAVSGRDAAYNVLDLVHTTIKGLAILITSGILMYRYWELHSHSRHIIYILFILWLACLACLIGHVVVMVTLEQDTSAVLFLLLFWLCNVAITACASFAIIYRMFVFSNTTHRENLGHSLRNTGVEWWIFVASGSLYTLTSGSVLVVTAIDDPQGTISLVLDAVNFSMAAITSNAVLANVNQQRDEKDDTASRRDMESELKGWCEVLVFQVPPLRTSIQNTLT